MLARILGLIMVFSSFAAQADEPGAKAGALIIDRRANVAGETLVYTDPLLFCGAPYSGILLDDHSHGSGMDEVFALPDGQHICPDSQYEFAGIGIAVLSLGKCQKTSTENLSTICTGVNAASNTAVKVQCTMPRFHYEETRYRELVNGYWMRRSHVVTDAPNAKRFSETWREETGLESGPAESEGTPYVVGWSNMKLLKQTTNRHLKIVDFQMSVGIAKNKRDPNGSTPIGLPGGTLLCKFKCDLLEENECYRTQLKPAN